MTTSPLVLPPLHRRRLSSFSTLADVALFLLFFFFFLLLLLFSITSLWFEIPPHLHFLLLPLISQLSSKLLYLPVFSLSYCGPVTTFLFLRSSILLLRHFPPLLFFPPTRSFSGHAGGVCLCVLWLRAYFPSIFLRLYVVRSSTARASFDSDHRAKWLLSTPCRLPIVQPAMPSIRRLRTRVLGPH